MTETSKPAKMDRGQWMAFLAAFLGWLFDGFEIGLVPLVARPALFDLLGTPTEGEVGQWIGILTAGFLVGAAAGGVLFGWLGDRIGRVRAMSLSIMTYAIFSGACGFASNAPTFLILRFIASLGMGGEWSLGVSLVMELWPNRSRGWLAGMIGAASNIGIVLVAVISLNLEGFVHFLEQGLSQLGVPDSKMEVLASHGGWRVLMLIGALPALLTFFIRIFVPESKRWSEEKGKGATSHWAASDLLGVLIGSLGPFLMIWLFASNRFDQANMELGWVVRLVGSIVGLSLAVVGYLYPVTKYLQRTSSQGPILGAGGQPVRKLMLLGAVLSGVALLGTWGSMQWAAPWADQLKSAELNAAKAAGNEADVARITKLPAKEYTQIASGIGAVVGTFLAGWLGYVFSRRTTYVVLCLLSLGTIELFFFGNKSFGTMFVATSFIAGATTAAFYGWLPLYLPELFPTRVRATGQGFAFNFGRILAAIGALQTGALMKYFGESYQRACGIMALIYLLGVVFIWFLPETKDKELPA
ncbi:MFS transporter [Planctomicrobium sp. SH664]|uniref:MFS transporter n=1 Tax=Planctomicrobium sp. SH664 TaxID=3448125 RepID=UPI003F5AE03D